MDTSSKVIVTVGLVTGLAVGIYGYFDCVRHNEALKKKMNTGISNVQKIEAPFYDVAPPNVITLEPVIICGDCPDQ